MLFFIAIVTITLLVLYIQHAIQQKYINFVHQNSMALKKLIEINQKYIFMRIIFARYLRKSYRINLIYLK